MMSRDYIDENDIISRYVSGALSESEAESFEDTYFCDRDLAAMVEAEQTLQDAFRAKSPGVSPIGSGRASWRAKGPWVTAIAAAAATAAVLTSSYFKLQLARAERQQKVLLSELATVRAPSLSAIDATLSRMRSGEESIPAVRLPIPQTTDGQVLLELPAPAPSFTTLQLDLRFADRSVWRVDWAEQDPPPQRLQLKLPSTFLQPGNYTIRITTTYVNRESDTVQYQFATYLGPVPEA